VLTLQPVGKGRKERRKVERIRGRKRYTERSFVTLRRLKSRMKSLMSVERMRGLALLNVP